jgi:hypothetical protein
VWPPLSQGGGLARESSRAKLGFDPVEDLVGRMPLRLTGADPSSAAVTKTGAGDWSQPTSLLVK